MSDRELSDEIGAVSSRIEARNSEMEELHLRADAAQMTSDALANSIMDVWRELMYKNQGDYVILRELQSEQDKRYNQSLQTGGPRTFVNSYGEATTREITSASYKRSQRRLDDEIDRRMRGYR